MISLAACDSPPQKSLNNQEWTEFGIYQAYEDQGTTLVDRGEVTGGELTLLDDQGTAGEMTAGEMTAGEMTAGEMTAGEMTAGEMTAGEMTAGEMTADLIEDPLRSFSEANVPRHDQVALWDGSEGMMLWWIREYEIWMSRANIDGQLGSPTLIYTHSSRLTNLHLGAFTQSAYLILEDENQEVSLITLNSGEEWTQDLLTSHRLPLSGGVQISTYENQMVIAGNSDEISLLSWVVIEDGTLPPLQSQDDVLRSIKTRFAPSDWPLPSSIGWVSGQAVFRFDDLGECVYLTTRYNVNGSTPCLSTRGYFLSAPSETSLLMLDQSGALTATIASSPDNEANYLIAQIELDGQSETSLPRPVLGPFRGSHRQLTFVGRPYDDSSEDGLKSRLVVAEPQGLWFSEGAWSEWPYPNVRAAVRKGKELWMYTFDEMNAPRRIRASLQINTFNERTPYGLTFDTSCRPTVERCDELDNNCDGIIDNGLCCDTGRSPYEGYFIPSATPREFFVTDVENADASRYAVRVADNRWEIWAIYYGSNSRNLVSFGTIEGAHNALGFTAAGGYSALVAQDAEGTWKVFWNHSDPNASLKEPEVLGCEEALALSNIGNLTTSSSPAVICNDRVVHLRADRDEEGTLLPIDTYLEPFENLPNIEWATFIRHSSRGESSMVIAFQSLAGNSWEVSKLSVSKGVGNSLNFGLPQSLNNRLEIDPSQQPHPIYLHRDDSPGFPGSLPYLEINEDQVGARINIPRENGRVWHKIHFGASTSHIDYTELPSKLVASATHEDGLSHNFYVLDLKDYEHLTSWVTNPTFTWQTPLLEDQVSTSTPPLLLWSLIHGNYYNYIATLFEAGETSIDGANLPRGVWALRLYSVTNCVR